MIISDQTLSRERAATTRRRSARQEELLDALETIVLSEGFGGLTVGDLARRLSCSRSTLYALAPSKEELFLALEERLLNRVQATAQACAERETDPTKRLIGYIAGAIESVRDVGTPYLAEVSAYAPARQLLAEFQRTTISQLRTLIEAGIAEGAFHALNARLAAEVLDAAVSRIQDPRVLAETGLTASEALEHVSQLLTQGLLKPPARRRR